MRKLNVLKAIIDILWILGIIATPLLLALIGIILFNDSLIGKSNILINGMFIDNFTGSSKIVVIIPMITYIISIYCLYLFRKILSHLKNLELFHDFVITKMNSMGNLLILTAILNTLPKFIYKQVYESKISLDVGLNPVVVTICLGLFFMILSEIFKIAKKAKEENELTV